MTYVWLNLRSMFKNHRDIFLLIIISEILTALCMLFSYGLIMQATDENELTEFEQHSYVYDINGVQNLKETVPNFIEELGDGDIKSFYVGFTVNDKTGFRLEGNASIDYTSSEDNVAPGACILSEFRSYLIEDGRIFLGDREYEVAETRKDTRGASFGRELNIINGIGVDFKMSVYSIPDYTIAKGLDFTLTCEPTSENIDRINNLVMEYFGGKSRYVPKAIDLMKIQENNTFYAYALLIVIIVVINLSMYFRYIIEQRRRQIQIFTVCGATAEQINVIFLIENLIELLTGYAVAFIAFRFGLLRAVGHFYKGIGKYYTPKMYLITSLIFIAGSMSILMLLISPHIREAASAGEESK